MRSNHQKQYLILLFTIAVFLFISCGKDSEVFTAYDPTGNIEDFFTETDLPVQEFTGNASNGILIKTENNTFIDIPSNILVDDQGNIVTDGVEIEVIEIFEKSDMVLLNKPTMTKNDYLISRGEFFIKVKKNGKELKVKDGYKYKMYVPNKEPDPEMELFYGNVDSGTLIWEEAEGDQRDNIRVNEWQLQDSSNIYFDFGYELFCDKFTWINIDKYNDIPDEDKTSVCVELPEELYSPQNTVVFMVLKNEYSVVAFSPDADTKRWCEPYGMVPKGWEVFIITISSLGDDVYHFGIVEATITENDVFTIIPEEKTFEEIKTILESL